jgi:hypothetical protein
MDDDYLQREIDKALAIGQQNAALIVLARNWCEHADYTKGPMGTGELEIETGLPIGGGSLRCDYAKVQTEYGMVLERTSLDFYEQNCVGCPHRKPTGRTPDLSTWADELIAERTEAARKAEDERTQAQTEREARRRGRRLNLGDPDPTAQSILDLIDRIDSEDRDAEAEALLLSQARLSPEDFPDEILAHLASEGLAIGRPAMIEVIVTVFELTGRPAPAVLLPLAFDAIRSGTGAKAAGRVVAVHATDFPVDDAFVRGAIGLAAGEFDFYRASQRGGEPSTLQRFYARSPDKVVDALSGLLRDSRPEARAFAAHAALGLVKGNPEAGPALLDAALEAVVLPDPSSSLGDPFASSTAAHLVAEVLVHEPEPTDKALAERLSKADDREARRLWKCYDDAIPSRFRGPTPAPVIELVEERAVQLLRQDLAMDTLTEVADSLVQVSRTRDSTHRVSLADLVDLAMHWLDRLQRFDQTPVPPNMNGLDFLSHGADRIRLSSVLHRVEEAIEPRAAADVPAYLALMTGLLDPAARTRPDDDGRALLLKGLRGMATQADLDVASGLLLGVLKTGDVLERTEALAVVEEVRGSDLKWSEDIQAQVVANLKHERLMVVLRAIRALHRVTVKPDDVMWVVDHLMGFALNYNEEPGRDDDVERALGLSLRLSEGQDYARQVKQIAFGIIAKMPSVEAADVLLGLHRLEGEPEWVGAVVHAMNDDTRAAWANIHDRRRDDLLQALAGVDTADLAPSFDALETLAMASLDLYSIWTWSIADLFARHGEHERALRLCQAVSDATPDTPERHSRSLLARLVTLLHRIDATQDPVARRALVEEAAELAEEHGK